MCFTQGVDVKVCENTALIMKKKYNNNGGFSINVHV